jgi:conjugative transfer signal peptidase TraF
VASAQGIAHVIRRRTWIAATVVAATLATLALPVSRVLVWNTTASIPTGLYWIRDKPHRYVGERIAVEPPPELRRMLAERGYLTTNVPLLKRVAALGGQTVCRVGVRITIDGQFVGVARQRDRMDRALPSWSGCQRLRRDQIFVMNPAAPDSFDGRYFGMLHASDVIGRATPFWTDEAGTGDHRWFAPQHAEIPSPTNQGD